MKRFNRMCRIALATVLGLAATRSAQAIAINGFDGYGNDTDGPEIYLIYTGASSISVVLSSGLAAFGLTPYADQGPYDGIDDTYVGVINQSAFVLNSIFLNGGTIDIFGFDDDGISTYGSPVVDASGYAGPGTSFSGINAAQTQGTVVFTGGLAPGGRVYFSLEEALVSANGPLITGTVPDAGSSVTLLGGSLAGLGLLRRRFKL